MYVRQERHLTIVLEVTTGNCWKRKASCFKASPRCSCRSTITTLPTLRFLAG